MIFLYLNIDINIYYHQQIKNIFKIMVCKVTKKVFKGMSSKVANNLQDVLQYRKELFKDMCFVQPGQIFSLFIFSQHFMLDRKYLCPPIRIKVSVFATKILVKISLRDIKGKYEITRCFFASHDTFFFLTLLIFLDFLRPCMTLPDLL